MALAPAVAPTVLAETEVPGAPDLAPDCPPWSCPNNLLLNPSFESVDHNGKPTNWTHTGSGVMGTTTAYTPPDGVRIGYVYHTSPATTAGMMYQQVAAVPGAGYTMTFYSGTHDPSKHPTIAIRFYNAAGTEIGTPAIHTITSDLEISGLGGPYTLNATAPAGAAKLRVIFTDPAYSTAGAKGDALCLQVQALDLGDLPDSPYPTLLANDGPRHAIVSGVQLGATVDAEADGQPNAAALGDDQAGTPDDEDGVTFLTPLVVGKAAKIQVSASIAGCLNAWIDYNGNGVLTDSGEQIAANLAVAAGANTLNVTAPTTAHGVLFSRFRFTQQCSQGGQSPTGLAASGEVEDYALAALGDYVWVDSNSDGVQNDGNTGLNGVTVNLLNGSGSAVVDASGNPITTLTANNPQTGNPGWYEFAGLPAGSYIVQFLAPGGYLFTNSGQGGDAALDSDANTDTGRSAVVTLAAGQVNPTIDAGLITRTPTAVSLAGFSARGRAPWGGLALLGVVLAGLVVSLSRRQG